MIFLQEVLRRVHTLDDTDQQATQPDDELDLPIDDEFGDLNLPDDVGVDINDQDAQGTDDEPSGDIDLPLDEPMVDGDSGDDSDIGDIANHATDDPDKQGVIRSVDKAHLVYKRGSEDGGFEELWVYNIGTLKDDLDVRKAILSGTDIPTNQTTSKDGSQSYTMWSAGNAELIHITGLPN